MDMGLYYCISCLLNTNTIVYNNELLGAHEMQINIGCVYTGMVGQML